MQVSVKKWGNGNGILFTKEFLSRAGLTINDILDAEIVDGRIVLSPGFRHRSLKERAADYGGRLNLSDEVEWDGPVGNEVW